MVEIEIKKVIRTQKFERNVKAIKDKPTKTTFRIIYAVKECNLYLLRFEHRGKVYRQ